MSKVLLIALILIVSIFPVYFPSAPKNSGEELAEFLKNVEVTSRSASCPVGSDPFLPCEFVRDRRDGAIYVLVKEGGLIRRIWQEVDPGIWIPIFSQD